MKKNIEEDSGFDAYAKINEENALKEKQEKALEDYESRKDEESGNLYDDVNKKYKLKAEQEKAEETYRADFQNREKNLGNEKKDWEKLREKDDAKKEKRAAKLKEKEGFKQSYKRQFGEAEDNIDNTSIDNKKTVVNKIDAPVDNAPVSNAPIDNETDLQKIIRERNENMPDKIGDDLLDNNLKERAAEILATGEKDAETQRKIINKQDKRIDGLSIENEQLEKFFEKANNRLDAMKDELDRQIEEVKNPTIKETIIKFLKKPKVKGAIIFGLAGAAVYAASGGTAVPVYFAVKAALAKAGISIFVPAAAGHGLSTWGTAAAAGGATGEFAGYLAKKLGLSKGEKSDREKSQEGLENLKNIGSGQQQAGETSAEASIETPVKKEGFIGKMKKRIFGEKEHEKASQENTEQQPLEAGVETVNESIELAEPAKAVETGEFEKPEAKAASKDNKPEGGNVILEEAPEKKENLSAENSVSLENQKKLFEARNRFFGLSRLIGQNKEKINTTVLETLAGLVNSEIEKGKYETVAPVAELANDLVKNKEKFEFLGKEANAGNRDNDAKEKLISEIKTHALRMENNGLLGVTAEEKEKNRLAIAALLDSKEFKSQI